MMKVVWRHLKVWLIPLLVTLIIFLLMRVVFLFGYVPTASMEPTLERDSFILGVRIFSEIKKGDIVIFEHDGRLLVKRVAALPGETVDLSTLTYMATLEIPVRNTEVLVVPEDCYYLLGDNTQNSLDSRYWEYPFVNREQIVAKMIYPASFNHYKNTLE